MARSGKVTRAQRREDPPAKPVVLPSDATAEDGAAQTEKPIAEARVTAGALPKQKKHATVKNKKQREKAIKAAEFAGKLDNKKASREARKVKKDTAKRLWE